MPHLVRISIFGLVGFMLWMAACAKQTPPKDEVKEPPSKKQIAPMRSTASVRHFESASKALSHIIEQTSPSIIGFGEYHQQSHTSKIRSALKRFTDELLPTMKDSLSDLVVETWVSTGHCGKEEAAVTREVANVTQRPEATEDETVNLIKKAAKLGIRPRVLKLECSDYNRLQVDGGVDYLALLTLVGKRLEKSAKEALAYRIQHGAGSGAKGIAIFGGAIHNDADPSKMWADVSFGRALRDISPRYVEIDLYVPEFIENSTIAKQESWFPLFQKHVSSKSVTLIKQAPRTFIIIFKRGVVSP